jgi:two-component system response regulator HydG
MLTSFSEFKFYQSFRIPVEENDDLRFLVERENVVTAGDRKDNYIYDAKLVDISVTGLGFASRERISVGDPMSISLQFKKMHLDLTGTVVRAFSNDINDKSIIYGVELDEEKKIARFLEQFILSFSPERLKDCLIESALKERYTKASDGFEMFSLLLSLFKDITNYADREGFLDNMIEEVARVINAQRASIFLINPDSNELEAISAIGVDTKDFKFDYRLGIAGSVFTTGVALNIDTTSDRSRFNDEFDKSFNFQTRSIICYPIHNREDKIVGVIEVLNKKNQDRFTVEDEKTMKVLALVFSAVFHNYTPMSDSSQIRRFSTPFDRKYALIGKTQHIGSLRNSIIKTKDLDSPVLICGEKGVGKSLFGQIIHSEGQRGLKLFEIIECADKNYTELAKQLWGPAEEDCKLIRCQGGTLVLNEIGALPLNFQKKLIKILDERRLPDSKISLDVRIIATSSDDIGLLVEKGEFDRDLYQYVCRSMIYIEPLRRRVEDIPLLVDYYLKVECKRQGLLLKNFSPKAMKKLQEYDWPGNVAELKRCIERAVLYNPKTHIITEAELENTAAPVFDITHRKRMFGDLAYVGDHNISLRDRVALMEREMIISEIRRNSGNKSQAAKAMGISREALRKKLLISKGILEELEKSKTKPALSVVEDSEDEKKAA